MEVNRSLKPFTFFVIFINYLYYRAYGVSIFVELGDNGLWGCRHRRTKMGPFCGCLGGAHWALMTGGTGSGNSVSLRKNKGAGIAYFLSKVRRGMIKKASLGGHLKSTKKDPEKL